MAEGSLSRWAAIIVFPLFTISTVLVACFGQNIGANGDRILTTLASTQAAIFAIVFSIVILGVQLSASRYSPRLVSLFRNNSAYKFIIGLFFRINRTRYSWSLSFFRAEYNLIRDIP